MSVEQPDLSICIVNWNARDELCACLDSISDSVSDIGYEVLLVDNASTDGSATCVRETYDWVRLYVNRRNRGFAAACNQAMRMASGRYILLLNPDTRLKPKAMDDLVRFADSHPEAGIAGCRILNPDGSLQYSCRRFPTVIAGMLRNTPLSRLLPGNRHVADYLMTDYDHRTAMAVDWVSGAVLLVRQEVLRDIGFLDERFFMYCEDMDFCRRAGLAGWQVVYCPEAEVVHTIGCSSSKAYARMVLAFHQSMYRYYCKHNRRRLRIIRNFTVAAGLIVRFALVLLAAELKELCHRCAGRLGPAKVMDRVESVDEPCQMIDAVNTTTH